MQCMFSCTLLTYLSIWSMNMYTNSFSNLSPKVVVERLGQRLKQARLNQNVAQEALAERVGLSRGTIVNAEKGQVTLENFVAILQALKLADQLHNFLPEQPISPVQLAKLAGAKRQRASGGLIDTTHLGVEEDSSW